MSREWGRSDIAGRWLSTKPVWVAAAFALGLAGAMAAVLYQYATVWTPLQRAYAPARARRRVARDRGHDPRTLSPPASRDPDRGERTLQASVGTLRVTDEAGIRGRVVVILDDTVTTGNSVAAAWPRSHLLAP